jgi:hypothetical protein
MPVGHASGTFLIDPAGCSLSMKDGNSMAAIQDFFLEIIYLIMHTSNSFARNGRNTRHMIVAIMPEAYAGNQS